MYVYLNTNLVKIILFSRIYIVLMILDFKTLSEQFTLDYDGNIQKNVTSKM